MNKAKTRRLDELTPNALPRRNGSVKRKSEFDTPMPRKVSRPDTTKKSTGKGGKTDGLAYDSAPIL